ncbi:MAG: hypothetical protein HWE24_06985 [Oceanospirillaceae bacterium]|nr:hypothetical protein [Oceanospirillaceae bacterium]
MKISSELYDSRINAKNLLVEMSIGEYEKLVSGAMDRNEFQRKRIRSSKTVYALLKEDLLKHCVIPPIVLALTRKLEFDADKEGNFEDELSNCKDSLLILDGLQRTYTIFDLLRELRTESREEELNSVLNSNIRVEVYIGLNRLGILYRMLTLNTGQTPMSLRQQIEMLYLDYLKTEIDGVTLVRESDNQNASSENQYSFKDIVEGFNSYLDRDELPLDKGDIMENIRSLEKLSRENQDINLFEEFVKLLNLMVGKLNNLCGKAEVSEQFLEERGTPFGKNVLKVVKRVQSLSGFGAAVGKLIDFEAFGSLSEITRAVDDIKISDPEEFLEEMNLSLLWLKQNSKKIGNAQRSFFAFFYRDLLNKESDSYGLPLNAAKTALKKYQSQNM